MSARALWQSGGLRSITQQWCLYFLLGFEHQLILVDYREDVFPILYHSLTLHDLQLWVLLFPLPRGASSTTKTLSSELWAESLLFRTLKQWLFISSYFLILQQRLSPLPHWAAAPRTPAASSFLQMAMFQYQGRRGCGWTVVGSVYGAKVFELHYAMLV